MCIDCNPENNGGEKSANTQYSGRDDVAPTRNVLASSQAGLSISFDALQEELNNTSELVATLFHRLDPILLRSGDDAPGMSETPSSGSAIQQIVWDKTAMISRLNNQLRELSSRIDV